MTEKSEKAMDFVATLGTAIQDFLVEVLGNLVPGMVFTLAAAITLGWTVYTTCWLIEPLQVKPASVTPSEPLGKSLAQNSPPIDRQPNNEALESIPQLLDRLAAVITHKAPWDFITENAWAVLIFLLALSYATGCVLFRIDVKTPDFISARYMLRRTKDTMRYDGAVRPNPDKTLNTKDVMFPYRYMREYLSHRSLHHLAKLIPWSGNDPSNASRDRRSKMFLNILKLRLQFLMPEKCRAIVRNEAHVRLVSSFWHALRALAWITAGALGLTMVTAVYHYSPSYQPDACQPKLAALFGWDIILIFFALFVKSRINKFFHYQRVREIIDILETAHFAAAHNHKIFQDLWSVHLEWVVPKGEPAWEKVRTDQYRGLEDFVDDLRNRFDPQGVTVVFSVLREDKQTSIQSQPNEEKETSESEDRRRRKPGLYLENERQFEAVAGQATDIKEELIIRKMVNIVNSLKEPPTTSRAKLVTA